MIPKQGNKNHDRREEKKYLAELVHGLRGTVIPQQGKNSGTIPTWLHIIQFKKHPLWYFILIEKKKQKTIYKIIIKKTSSSTTVIEESRAPIENERLKLMPKQRWGNQIS